MVNDFKFGRDGNGGRHLSLGTVLILRDVKDVGRDTKTSSMPKHISRVRLKVVKNWPGLNTISLHWSMTSKN